MEKIYYTANEVAELMGVVPQTAYRVIRKLNDELQAKGYETISGRINRKYFIERVCYGGMPDNNGKES